MAYWQEAEPSPDILSAAKLDVILQAYEGKLENLPRLANGATANRLNFRAIERLDVVSGLVDYATMGKEHERRLLDLYSQGERKPLGEKITLRALLALKREMTRGIAR